MADELQWEAFDQLHVIRRLRQIIGTRWKIQINFTDAQGYLRNVEKGKFFKPLNPVCSTIVASDNGFKGCIGTVRSLSKKPTKKAGQTPSLCHAGFSALSYPLQIEGAYLGSIFADGFILEEKKTEQLKQIKAFLQDYYQSDREIAEHLAQIPVLSQQEVAFLSELLGAIVEEIIIVQKTLVHSKAEVASLRQQLEGRHSFAQMIGKSPLMQDLYQLIERLCEVDSTVLIQGENGTGKELIARALHFNSPRKKHKFIAVNCAAVNDNLLESELFGHVKGAFTNALKDKVGLFEAAENGTLFLDEIGDISLAMQVKLLRVLQDGSFTPVGGVEEKKSSARIVCATNRNLVKMIDEGSFREDLYYRLNVINVLVPPLRDRPEDIPLLVETMLHKQGKKLGQTAKHLSHGALQKLMNYSWPGNVRELENEVERLVVLGRDTTLLTEDTLSTRIAHAGVGADGGGKATALKPGKIAQELSAQKMDLKTAVSEVEKEIIKAGLLRHKGNKSRLAIELGISRANLISKVEKYGLT